MQVAKHQIVWNAHFSLVFWSSPIVRYMINYTQIARKLASLIYFIYCSDNKIPNRSAAVHHNFGYWNSLTQWLCWFGTLNFFISFFIFFFFGGGLPCFSFWPKPCWAMGMMVQKPAGAMAHGVINHDISTHRCNVTPISRRSLMARSGDMMSCPHLS